MVFFKLGFQLTILLKAKERMKLHEEKASILSITKNCGSNTEEERGLHVKKTERLWKRVTARKRMKATQQKLRSLVEDGSSAVVLWQQEMLEGIKSGYVVSRVENFSCK